MDPGVHASTGKNRLHGPDTGGFGPTSKIITGPDEILFIPVLPAANGASKTPINTTPDACMHPGRMPSKKKEGSPNAERAAFLRFRTRCRPRVRKKSRRMPDYFAITTFFASVSDPARSRQK
jgi:hypothetical protein